MDSGSVASSSAYASGYATIKSSENLVNESADTIASTSQLNSGNESASEQQIPSADQVSQALLDLAGFNLRSGRCQSDANCF